ncbi:MAG: T9SS type A sorting domain-containing protein [Saprospiraceae bacterium]|nr:T9SS type A sorting domain-containing protein [Saprospiraceae bacterium]
MKKVLPLAGAVLFCLGLQAQIQNYSVGSTVNDFTVITTHGDTINLYSLTAQGKYVVLDFFFADCPPCQATVPDFYEFHERFGCNSGEVFCLSLNNGLDDNEKVQWYEDTFGGAYSPAPSVSNEGGGPAVDDDFNPAAYPTYCLIGPDNTLLNMDIWPISNYTTFANALAAGGSEAEETECSTTAIDEPTRISGVALYPNPAAESTMLNVSLTESSQVVVEVFNLVGEKVMEVGQYAPGLQASIPLRVRDLQDGVYLVRVTDGQSARTSTVKLNVMQR